MTERLFLDAPTQRTVNATVIGRHAGGLMLDRTVFYARSGGQPGDTGRLSWDGGECQVGEAIKGDGTTILHPLPDGIEGPPVGVSVIGSVDWSRRYQLMRMHTALHLLCALLPGAAVTGGQIGEEKSRLDFHLTVAPRVDVIEQGLNALITEDHPVRTEWVDESVLDEKPELVRTLSVKPPRGTGRLRLVRIGDAGTLVDLQPCGGTHVSRTSEIGLIKILKIENKGRQNRRIVAAFA